ncbi:MAG TPA: alpha/beta hydrolase [Cellvibrionaceae bacterium]
MLRLLLVLFLSAQLSARAEVIAVEESGSGETTLVMISGLASSYELWQPWVQSYQGEYRVLTVQLAGFAGVAPAAPAVTNPVAQAADALSEQLRQQGGKLILLGHSLGGQLALQVARQLPEQVQKVLVIDSLPFLAELYWPGITAEETVTRAGRLSQFMLQQSEAEFRQQQRAGLGVMSKQPDFLPTLTDWADSSDKTTVIHAMKELLSSDYRPILSDIKVPVSVMLAWDTSMPLSKQALESLYQRQYQPLSAVNFVTIEDSYHFVMKDQPQAFNQALTQFLEEQ